MIFLVDKTGDFLCQAKSGRERQTGDGRRRKESCLIYYFTGASSRGGNFTKRQWNDKLQQEESRPLIIPLQQKAVDFLSPPFEPLEPSEFSRNEPHVEKPVETADQQSAQEKMIADREEGEIFTEDEEEEEEGIVDEATSGTSSSSPEEQSQVVVMLHRKKEPQLLEIPKIQIAAEIEVSKIVALPATVEELEQPMACELLPSRPVVVVVQVICTSFCFHIRF